MWLMLMLLDAGCVCVSVGDGFGRVFVSDNILLLVSGGDVVLYGIFDGGICMVTGGDGVCLACYVVAGEICMLSGGGCMCSMNSVVGDVRICMLCGDE